MFRYVREKGYEPKSFRDYVKGERDSSCILRRARERRLECMGQGAGARRHPSRRGLRPPYDEVRIYFPVFTGLSGLISSATASLICSMVSILFAPKRGMVEQGKAACEL